MLADAARVSAFSEPDSGWRRTPGFAHYMDVDLDGDGKTDPAVYNITTGDWYFALTGSGYLVSTSALGGPGEDPVGVRPAADGQ